MENYSASKSVPSVAIYRRVSSAEQVAEGYSLGDQETICREYLDRVYGQGKYTVEVYSDEGISGKLGFRGPGLKKSQIRPGLSAMVNDIEAGKVSVVIFLRLDRLSRNARVWLEFLQDYVMRYNVALISVRDNLDMTSPMGRFAANILVMAAELFADLTADNVKLAMRRRREDGFPTGQIGFGWKRKAPLGDQVK